MVYVFLTMVYMSIIILLWIPRNPLCFKCPHLWLKLMWSLISSVALAALYAFILHYIYLCEAEHNIVLTYNSLFWMTKVFSSADVLSTLSFIFLQCLHDSRHWSLPFQRWVGLWLGFVCGSWRSKWSMPMCQSRDFLMILQWHELFIICYQILYGVRMQCEDFEQAKYIFTRLYNII